MKRIYSLPLFWKFIIALITIVSIYGGINLYFINSTLFGLSNNEINLHGFTVTKGIAERSVDPILYDDIPFLDKMISDYIRIDSSIAYIFILNKDKNVVVNTIEAIVPFKLISANELDISVKENFVRISNKLYPNKVIRDFAVSILDGDLGIVRVGIYEKDFTTNIQSINNFFLSMIVVFLFFGILCAFFFSYVITYPIKKISRISEKLNLDSINDYGLDIQLKRDNRIVLGFKNIFNVTDELDVLTAKFNEMIMRLHSTYNDLQNAQTSLIQSEKMASLGTLSAGIAHEINNPISGIYNCIRRISDSPDNIKQNTYYLEMMNEAVNKIEKVVGGLLNFCRKPEMNFEEVILNKIIENVLMLSAFQLEKSRIVIKKKYIGQDVKILASSNHIEQVVLNLVLNSIEAIDENKLIHPSHHGEIQFEIRDSKNFVDFEIADNGIGFPEDKLNSIFDPFFTKKKIRQGTGLGLAVSFSIVEQHGGIITAHNNSTGGLTFKVSLPKKK